MTAASESTVHPILLYDGVCGLCNRLVQFILRRDEAEFFRFASLQSVLAGRILARHGRDAGNLDTVYVVVDYGLRDGRLLAWSDAVVYVLRHVGMAERRSLRTVEAPGPIQASHPIVFWRLVGILLQVVPRAVRDWGYRIVARHRYRIFGRYDTCTVPTAQTRSRFLDG